MVEARSSLKAFDGVKPENVVFGETLGEGKSHGQPALSTQF